jgi:competence protein ComEC
MGEDHQLHRRFLLRPLAPLAIALITGVGAGASFPGAHGILWVLVVVIVAWMGIAIRRRRPLVAPPLVLCLAMGYLSIQPWLGVELPQDHVGRFVDQGVWRIEGRVCSGVESKRHRWGFVLDGRHLSRQNVRHAVRGGIKVTGRGKSPNLVPGDKVSLQGHLRSIRNFANPGGFDYQRHMALQDIRARVYARRGSLQRMVPASAVSWRSRVDPLRRELSNRMSAALAGKSSETIALLKALILGERREMSREQQEACRRAGVSHILAISGLHIGCVALAALGLFNWLLCWIPFFLRRAWARKGAAVFSLGITAGYGILAGLSPSTQRAMIMAAAFLLGFWVGRRHDWPSGLALAAAIIVLISPPTVLSVSFQLSFAAVLAIFAGFQAIPIRPPTAGARRWKTISQRLLAFLWVSTLATAGTLPLVLYYFNQVSLVGLLTNLIVVPIVTVVVVPAGLAGVMASAVSADLAALCWHAAYGGLVVVGRVVTHVSGWPWSAVTTVTPTLLEIVLYYGVIGGCLYWKKLTQPRLALAVALLLVCGDAVYWSYVRFGRRQLRVTAVDVGQGSANLLELPGGDTVMIDGGGFSDNTAFDVGARILAPLLWRRKIRSIDLVILTHPNSDHLNGLLYLLQHFDVKAVWSNHEPVDTTGYRKWRRILARQRILHHDFRSLPQCFEHNGVRLEVLAPPRDFLERRAAETWRDPNNNSMVIRVSMGRVSLLMTGDIGERAELELVKRYPSRRLQSTVLMVPHHGSRKSSTIALLAAVDPAEAVISAGWRNRFGFPHGEALERLAAVGSRVWNTADGGAIQITTDGERYHIKATRKQ